MTGRQIRKLDSIFSQKVRKRAKCEWCGRSNGVQLQCAHIHSRTYHNTRWKVNNALCLCAGCHRLAHNRPTIFTEFVKNKMGIEKYNKLNLEAMAIKFPKDTYEEILGELNDKT